MRFPIHPTAKRPSLRVGTQGFLRGVFMKDETPLPKQRSWIEAYGTPVALGAVILIVIIVIFSSVPASVQPKVNPSPGITEKEYYQKQTEDTDQVIRKAVQESGGDWNKIPPVGQQRIQELSQGHGKEMLEIYVERMKEEKKKGNAKSP